MSCDCEVRRQTKALKEINKTLLAILHTLSREQEAKEVAERLRASTDVLEGAVKGEKDNG